MCGFVSPMQSRNAEAIQRLDAALALQPRNWMVMEARGRVLQVCDIHALSHMHDQTAQHCACVQALLFVASWP